ncbi:hypothetical protein ACTBXC_002434 [Escherichia coli]|nr:hypothetical protein [Escherichia coli]
MSGAINRLKDIELKRRNGVGRDKEETLSDGGGLENRRPERVPEFESLRFRQTIKGLPNGSPFLFLLLVYTWYTNWYI